MRLLPEDERAERRRRLVATLGPDSHRLARDLARSGATDFRLNASHLSPVELANVLAGLRGACDSVPIVVDLQGAKIRLGRFEPRTVAAGEPLRFALDGRDGIPVPHPELFHQARPGDVLSVDDGRLRLDVSQVDARSLTAVAAGPGTLRPRKGVNVEPHPVALTGLTAADREACRMAASFGVRTFAFSFMSSAAEAAWLREAVPGCRVVGKIERAEAVERLDEIAAVVDGLWICRGDLGAQLGAAGLARFVARLEPSQLPCPVLMAGQVLEHLTRHAEPTRSEVCHLHDLLARGYAGIVLSDETAIGRDPVRAVETAAALLAALG